MPGLEPYAEAMSLITKEGSYTGIRVKLQLPYEGDVGDVTATDVDMHYFNFYVGFGDLIEGGVSFTRKWLKEAIKRIPVLGHINFGVWRQFLNPPGGAVLTHVWFGSLASLELTISKEGVVKLNLDNKLVGEHSGHKPGPVKMVMAVADLIPAHAEHQVWYSKTQFESAELQMDYKTWIPANKNHFKFSHYPPKTRKAVMHSIYTRGLFASKIPKPFNLEQFDSVVKLA